MLREPHRDDTPVKLFNPLPQDFTVQMADEQNAQHTYILHAQEIETFPAYIAKHIKKHLAEYIYMDRTGSRVTKESVMPGILSEIEIAS